MTYLIDSDRVIDFLNNDADAVEIIDHLSHLRPVSISMITYGEVYDGIYFGRAPDRMERGFLELLEVANVIPLNEVIMRRFARLRGTPRQSGQIVPDPDLMIAATALHYDLTIVTGNLRHFGRVPGLPIYEAPDAISCTGLSEPSAP